MTVSQTMGFRNNIKEGVNSTFRLYVTENMSTEVALWLVAQFYDGKHALETHLTVSQLR